jgi:hypothetical protein
MLRIESHPAASDDERQPFSRPLEGAAAWSQGARACAHAPARSKAVPSLATAFPLAHFASRVASESIGPPTPGAAAGDRACAKALGVNARTDRRRVQQGEGPKAASRSRMWRGMLNVIVRARHRLCSG